MAEWKAHTQPDRHAAQSGSGRGDSPASVSKAGRRRQEQLLSAILVTSFLVIAILAASSVFLMPDAPLLKNAELLLVVSTGIVAAAAYVLNRTGHYALAAPLTVGFAGLLVLAQMILIELGAIPHHQPNDTGLLVWLIVPVLLGSVLLPIRSLIVVMVLYIGSILMLPIFFPGVTLLGTFFRSLLFILVMSIVILLVTHYRNRLEADRQAELADKDSYRSLLETSFEGIAIKNARLFQAEREQRILAEALRQATAAINSTLDLDEVFDRILDQMNRVIPSDTSNIMLIEGDHIRIVRWRGYERFGGADHLEAVAFAIAETSTLCQMLETGDPVIVSDTREYEGWIRVSEWVRSYAGAPIRVRNQVIGFLNVNGATPGFFNNTHTDHLRAFADQASVAIENARLFKETSRRVEHLATLHHIGLAITSDLELTEVLNTLYQETKHIIDVDAFYVALYDQEAGVIEFPLLTGNTGRQEIEPVDIHGQPGITGYVIRTGLPLYVPDTWQAMEDKEVSYPIVPLSDPATRSYIGVPLVSRDHVIGVLSVQSYEKDAYTMGDVELLTTVASQATIAIENAQLFRTVERGKRDWEATFDTMQDAIVLVGKDQRIARVNRSFADLVQKPFLEIVGQKYGSVFKEVTCPLRICPLEKARQAGYGARCTHVYRGRAFEVEITPILEEGGEGLPPEPSSRMIQVMRDVTERKRAEEEIRRRNRDLALLNRIIAASASTQEMEHILEIVCRELAQALGVPRAAASLLDEGKKQSIIVAEFTTPGASSAQGLAIANSDDPIFQASLQQRAIELIDDARTDPRVAHWRDIVHQYGVVSLLMLPLMVEEQAVGHLYLCTTEPHVFTAEQVGLAQRTAEQVSGAIARARLEETQRRLSIAVEQAAEGIVITDTEGLILYINPALEQISGYSRASVIGQKVAILSYNQQNDTFYQRLWQTLTTGQVWQGRIVNARKDGTLYTVDSAITPVRNPAGEIVNYVATMRDVTRELELEEQFQQAQRMEALGRLAGGIAHDFNNLLTVIHISTRLLERSLHPEDPLWEHVQRIQETGERATRLNTQLLSFSRHQVIDPQILNLNEVVADMSRMLQRIIGEDIELVTHLAQELGPVKADPVQMDQVLMNLVINARDAMPEGGTLIVATANVVLDEAYATRHVDTQAGEYVQLIVRDTGVGMTEEVLAHLFEPFFTTKEGGQGTGLGLATVFGIVKQSGGHIRVHSKVGQGTAFFIHLPRVAGATIQEQPQAESGRDPQLARGSETILVVEDEAAVRQLTDRILSAFGYQVLTAENGAEGIAISSQHKGPIHMLLTDVIMPHMNGKELAERIKAERPAVKVLYMSGYTRDIIARRGVLEPETAFIAKPLTLERLTEKVRSVLDEAS
jgi:PAS domain S-box-containing protein